MRRLIWIAIVAVAVSGPVMAQSISGSPHDLGADGGLDLDDQDRICVFCHTPHNADITLDAPLWNHDMSAATYSYYSSTTYQGGAQSITGSTHSGLCMSCHDGTIALGALQNFPVVGTINTSQTMTGDADFGTILTNDHPVGFSYDVSDAADAGVHPVATVEASLPLYGAGNNLECASCHNVHDYDGVSIPFLRASNSGSLLCLTCHIK
jgi:hypothetical protein